MVNGALIGCVDVMVNLIINLVLSALLRVVPNKNCIALPNIYKIWLGVK